MQSLVDQVVCDVRAIEIAGVDVIYAMGNRLAQDGQRRVMILGRAKHTGAGELPFGFAASRRTTEAPPWRWSRRGRISGRPWRPKLTDSTAPMAPECQSFLDNVVARDRRLSIAELPRWITRERPVR